MAGPLSGGGGKGQTTKKTIVSNFFVFGFVAKSSGGH